MWGSFEDVFQRRMAKIGSVVLCMVGMWGVYCVSLEPVYSQGMSEHTRVEGQQSSFSEGAIAHLSKENARASLYDSTQYITLPKGVFIRKRDGDVPAHSVVISKEIQIGIHEVTQVQWEAVMGYNPSDVVNPYNPVESISWFEVQSFIDSLNVHSADTYAYRLPTEAEWEYACLAGTVSSGQISDVAWFNENSEERPHPIKQLEPNRWACMICVAMYGSGCKIGTHCIIRMKT